VIDDVIKACTRHGEFVLASGEKSSFKIDLPAALDNPEYRQVLLASLQERIPEYIQMVAGEGGAARIAGAYAEEFGLSHMEILLAPKHSASRLIRYDTRDKPVVLIEDVVTTGQSVLRAYEFLRLQNVRVDRIIGVVERGKPTFPDSIRYESILSM